MLGKLVEAIWEVDTIAKSQNMRQEQRSASAFSDLVLNVGQGTATRDGGGDGCCYG